MPNTKLALLKARADAAADEAEELVEAASDAEVRSYIRMRAVWARDAANMVSGKYAQDHVDVAEQHLQAAIAAA